MEDAEKQFKEALYRSAIEAAFFLKRLCEGTEDETKDTGLVGMRLGAAAQLLDTALSILSPGTIDPLADDDLVLVELTAD